jgi:shikimate dehydrogenase
VNTVGWDGDDLVGSSTDGAGFVASLAAVGVDVSGARVAVLGAGGAARSVIDALGRAGAAAISVINRTTERAESASLLAAVGSVGRPDDVTRADLVVNASSVGMGVDPATATDDDLPCDPHLLEPSQIVADLVYHPLRTAWLTAPSRSERARSTGSACWSTRLHCSSRSGSVTIPDVAVMRRAAESALADRRPPA